jgi:CHASE1-domain containing sensor protein
MGEVYRARDPRLGRDIAIKVLPDAVSANVDRLARFEKEARAAGALNHPHIMAIYDVGSHEGMPYVVMELLEGETLREVIMRRAPSAQQVLGWGLQVAQGLNAAHRKNIIHRDLKPENLFLTTEGQIKILDFGLAKLGSGVEVQTEVSTATNLTQPGVLVGTLAYMSPEQLRAQEVDGRSDVFSLGVVLYELLTAKHPFRRETIPATLTAILQDEPERFSVPPAAATVLDRCLEKEPEKRFQSAHDLAMGIEAALQGRAETTVLRDVEEKSPYPGLSSFTEENASNFFGREQEVETLWDRIRRRRLLAVIGPSGAGKTSFVRAGVVASRPSGWAALVSTPGPRPLRALGQVLGPELAADPQALRQLAGFDDPATAFDLLARWRRQRQEALIVLDQFEELFTMNSSETQSQFASLLGRLANEADIHVVLSLRDDFLMRCHDYAPLAAVFSELTPLGPLTRGELRRAVVEPAGKLGYDFEDETLVEEILRAVEGGRGALPLLAFAVSRLWNRRDQERRLLTRDAYQKIGGVEGALAQHAEATLDRIGFEHERTVRSIFRNLTTADGTRAVLTAEELLSAFPDRGVAEAVLRQLVDARLLTSYEANEGGADSSGRHVEILHESLLKAWPRLVRWQTQSAAGAQLRDQLRHTAHLWHERGKPDDLLWTGASYLEFQAWRQRYEGGLSEVEEDFAKAMAALANRNKRQRRIAAAGLVAALVLGWSFYADNRREAAARLAFAQNAKDLESRVNQSLSSSLENLYMLQSFIEAADGDVNRSQFRTLAYPMLARNREVYAFEWLPVVRETDRARYEAEAKAEHLREYQFWELGPDGKPAPVGRRAFYVPIHYMEPPSQRALGFDIASSESRWTTAGKARDSGEIALSAPFDLVEDETRKGAPVVAAYAPVYHGGDPGAQETRLKSVQGFAVAILRVAPLVDKAASDVGGSGLGLILHDPESPNAPALAERPPDAAKLPRRPGFQLAFAILADRRGERKWALDVFALPGFLPPKHWAIEVLSAGVLATTIGLALASLIRRYSRRRQQAAAA